MSISTRAQKAASAPRKLLPPGPRGLPYLGSALELTTDQLGFLTRMQRTYGDIVRVPLIGNFSMVMLFTPAAIHHVLAGDPRNFTSREFNYVLQALLGDGLLTIDGDYHRQQRRLVQPAFHKKRVESYANIMVQHTADMLATWHPGEVRDIAAEMQGLTLRIVAKTLFDVDLNYDRQQLGKAFTDVILFPNGRMLAWQKWLRIDSPLTPYGRFIRGIATLDETVYGIIAQRRQRPHDTGDMLSMLLEAQDDGVTMTDQQMRDEVMTFFGAGHETTSNALAWSFYLLAKHPDKMAILREELARVLAGRAPTLDDLPKLVYTDMVIKESMRLYPPVWAIGRRAINAFDVEGYHLPAGQIVLMSQWVLHRMPEIWGDPEVFRPERFDPSHPQDVPQFAYFPFGGGPRMCIGMPFAQMEARLLLAMIAQQYQPQLVPGHPVAMQPMVTLRPRYGLKMTLEV